MQSDAQVSPAPLPTGWLWGWVAWELGPASCFQDLQVSKSSSSSSLDSPSRAALLTHLIKYKQQVNLSTPQGCALLMASYFHPATLLRVSQHRQAHTCHRNKKVEESKDTQGLFSQMSSTEGIQIFKKHREGMCVPEKIKLRNSSNSPLYTDLRLSLCTPMNSNTL